jgi:hypothetical protein
MVVMSRLNCKCQKCVYFFDHIIRWSCSSASCVFGCRVLMEGAICSTYCNLQKLLEEENVDWKRRGSAFVLEAAVRLTSLGGLVKLNVWWILSSSSLEYNQFPWYCLHLLRKRITAHEIPVFLSLLIPHEICHPSVLPLFCLAWSVLNI